ncbi:MAG: ribulokinase, partial [Victivallales bacterium]|nr:ribulokinase [Victivallales bacterium]
MSSATYTIGLDYGSLSCRGVLVSTIDGTIIAEDEFVYPHAVIDHELPDGTPLPPQWALQDPEDFRQAFQTLIPNLLKTSQVSPTQVIAIGIDSTASTVIPVTKGLIPLCEQIAFHNRPHAWPKMWKHHAAAKEATEITDAAVAQGLPVVRKSGGAIGCESLMPKVLQIFHEDPEVFENATSFFELCDWIVSLLSGCEVRSTPLLTCKSLWTPQDGYPKGQPFDSITPKLVFHDSIRPIIAAPGESVGTLHPSMAQSLGLSENTIVTAGQMDGYAALPGVGIADEGTLMMMIGTSTADMILGREWKDIPGVCAAMEDANLPGFTNYAAGQACVGDMFKWFIDNCLPEKYTLEARQRGLSNHAYLSELAAVYSPGDTGLIALDWWNGNKSCINDMRLSGLLIGMTLATRPEHIYRALIEGTAFGARKIIDNFNEHGLPVHDIVACGG